MNLVLPKTPPTVDNNELPLGPDKTKSLNAWGNKQTITPYYPSGMIPGEPTAPAMAETLNSKVYSTIDEFKG